MRAQEEASSRAKTSSVDDEAWVERLRQVISTGAVAASEVDEQPEAHEPEAVNDLAVHALGDAPAVANALRDLERRWPPSTSGSAR